MKTKQFPPTWVTGTPPWGHHSNMPGPYRRLIFQIISWVKRLITGFICTGDQSWSRDVKSRMEEPQSRQTVVYVVWISVEEFWIPVKGDYIIWISWYGCVITLAFLRPLQCHCIALVSLPIGPMYINLFFLNKYFHQISNSCHIHVSVLLGPVLTFVYKI